MQDKDEVFAIDNTTPKISFGDYIHFIRDEFVEKYSRRHYFKKFESAPTGIRFRTTNKCNENCPHCFECSGPHNPLDYIAPDIISGYANSPNITFHHTYITGGEWSLIYDKHPHYLATIFQDFDVSKSDEYSIQTNARWVFGKNRDEIIQDLKFIQDKLAKHNIEMKLDTSVDRYHSSKSMDSVIEMIRLIASRPDFNNTKIRIMSCALDHKLANEKILCPEYFSKHGIDLKFEPRDTWFNPYFQRCWANNTKIVIHEEGPTMRIGRAAKNKFGYRIFDPRKQCGGIANNTHIDIAFREDGMAKWHDYYDWNIMTPYKNPDGTIKPIFQIRNELIKEGWAKHIKFNICNTMFTLLFPYIALPFEIWKRAQINKTYKENHKPIVIQVQKVL